MILVAMPRGDMVYGDAARSFYAGPTARPHRNLSVSSSSGTGNLNTIWGRVRDEYEVGFFSHFALLHADVSAPAGWVDTLIGELDEHAADLVSVVLPIKDGRRLTSTALDTDLWNPRRLTMREVFKLPETFGEHPAGPLLLNTGCWACKLGPWINDIHFRWGGDRIVKRAGVSVAEFQPEDWTFSRDMHKLRRKIVATRKVQARHIGTVAYDNFTDQGGWETDRNVREDFE